MTPPDDDEELMRRFCAGDTSAYDQLYTRWAGRVLNFLIRRTGSLGDLRYAGKDIRTINEHLRNIYDEGEVDAQATIRKFRMVQTEGSREVSREVVH